MISEKLKTLVKEFQFIYFQGNPCIVPTKPKRPANFFLQFYLNKCKFYDEELGLRKPDSYNKISRKVIMKAHNYQSISEFHKLSQTEQNQYRDIHRLQFEKYQSEYKKYLQMVDIKKIPGKHLIFKQIYFEDLRNNNITTKYGTLEKDEKVKVFQEHSKKSLDQYYNLDKTDRQKFDRLFNLMKLQRYQKQVLFEKYNLPKIFIQKPQIIQQQIEKAISNQIKGDRKNSFLGMIEQQMPLYYTTYVKEIYFLQYKLGLDSFELTEGLIFKKIKAAFLEQRKKVEDNMEFEQVLTNQEPKVDYSEILKAETIKKKRKIKVKKKQIQDNSDNSELNEQSDPEN